MLHSKTRFANKELFEYSNIESRVEVTQKVALLDRVSKVVITSIIVCLSYIATYFFAGLLQKKDPGRNKCLPKKAEPISRSETWLHS